MPSPQKSEQTYLKSISRSVSLYFWPGVSTNILADSILSNTANIEPFEKRKKKNFLSYIPSNFQPEKVTTYKHTLNALCNVLLIWIFSTWPLSSNHSFMSSRAASVGKPFYEKKKHTNGISSKQCLRNSDLLCLEMKPGYTYYLSVS